MLKLFDKQLPWAKKAGQSLFSWPKEFSPLSGGEVITKKKKRRKR